MARKETCHHCVYACRDMCQAMADFALGFPHRSKCANQAGFYGQMRAMPIGRVCPNFRLRPPEPEGNVKRILLTEGLYAYMDACDYDELSKYTWCLVNSGYAGRKERGKTLLMRRKIMKRPAGMFVDHVYGNKLDNTRARLRVCTRSENARNVVKHGHSCSRFKGVYYSKRKGRWFAAICVDGRMRHLGYFDDG